MALTSQKQTMPWSHWGGTTPYGVWFTAAATFPAWSWKTPCERVGRIWHSESNALRFITCSRFRACWYAETSSSGSKSPGSITSVPRSISAR